MESKIHNGKKIVSSINGISTSKPKKMKWDLYLKPHTKIKVKLVKNLISKKNLISGLTPKTVKLSEENVS